MGLGPDTGGPGKEGPAQGGPGRGKKVLAKKILVKKVLQYVFNTKKRMVIECFYKNKWQLNVL